MRNIIADILDENVKSLGDLYIKELENKMKDYQGKISNYSTDYIKDRINNISDSNLRILFKDDISNGKIRENNLKEDLNNLEVINIQNDLEFKELFDKDKENIFK